MYMRIVVVTNIQSKGINNTHYILMFTYMYSVHVHVLSEFTKQVDIVHIMQQFARGHSMHCRVPPVSENYFVFCCHLDSLLHLPDTTTPLMARYLLIKIWLPGHRIQACMQ